MALIHCPECQKEVSSVALACPQCAFPYPGRTETGNGHFEKGLRTCPDCKRIISRQVQVCPHCGAPAPEVEEIPKPLRMEEGNEKLMCPHCGVSFTRPPRERKPVEEGVPQPSNDEKSTSAPSRLSSVNKETSAGEGLMFGQSLPVGRKRKKNPLWEEKKESSHERSRHSRAPKGWTMYLLVMLAILLMVAGWALWELRDMSGLEALVDWNR